jgi:hypothetical protein
MQQQKGEPYMINRLPKLISESERDMKNEFERDETQSQDFRGDGCYNCMNNPMYKDALTKNGKPPLNLEVFTEAMDEMSSAYDCLIERETFDVYWKHLAGAFVDEDEFKEVIYKCIDAYVNFPAIAEILETRTHSRIETF